MKKTTPILFTITFLILLALPQIVTYAQQSAPVVEGLIAYIGEDHNVWILHGDSAESVRVTTDATDTDQYLLPRFSPDGSMLSYCKLIDKNPDKAMLFVSRVGEWQPILIADKVHCYDWPSLSYDWSPDSTKIIYTYPFTSNDEGGRGTEQWSSYRGIWLAEINNGAVSEIIPPPGKNPLINPQWSPDGDWIKLYEYSFTGSRGNLLTGHNDTGTLYTWFGGSSVWPGTSDWSPNSTQIVFDEIAFTGFRGAGIYIASPNGENITKIYSNPNQMARYPIWSPDGKTIAFQSTIVNQNPVLILVNSDGSEPLPIYTGHKRILPLAWSPSGRKLLFSTYVEDQIMMFVYDLDSRDTRQLGAAGAWSIDWNIGLIASEQTQETTVIPDFPYSDSLMVYVAPDRRLVLYDPQDGSELDLTEPLAVTSFYASPSGHKLVSGRRMISLEFEENDELHIIESVLPAAPIGEEINWAQDENQLAFMDWRDNVWIADSAGGGEQIHGAATLPDWSADGDWISYCAQDDVLFVLGENGSPIEIARNSDCETLWSPSKNLMAYNTLISSRAESSQAYVYDVNRGQSTHILENAGGISWSPDGKYLALKSVNIQTDVGSEYQVYASSPDGKKILELGEISDQTPGLSEWMITDTDYLFGPFAIAADLSSATRIADGILSYSKNSGLFLASNEELQFDILSCIDSTTGQQVRLLTVDRTDIPTNFLPGIWGWMSPDGKSAITRTYYDGAFVNLRHECEDAAQSNLPFGDFPDTGTYSDDGQFFYVNKINNGQQSYIQVYNLETSELERIPVATHYGAGWIRSLEKPGIHSITGRVTETDGAPLTNASVFIDGILVTTTDGTGSYAIIRLTPGEHKITIQKPDHNFSPAEYSITVPPDADRVDFRGSTGAPPIPSETPDSAAEPYAPPTAITPTTDDGLDLGGIISTVGSYFDWLLSYISTNIKQIILPGLYSLPVIFESGQNTLMIVACALGVLLLILLAIIIYVVRRARLKKTSDKPIPQKPQSVPVPTSQPAPEPAAGTIQAVTAVPQPTPVPTSVAIQQPVEAIDQSVAPSQAPSGVSDEEINEWLQQGMILVRDGDNAGGEKMFRKVAQARTDEPKAWLWLGYILAQKQEWRAAERCFKLAQKYGHPNAEKALIWLQDQVT